MAKKVGFEFNRTGQSGQPRLIEEEHAPDVNQFEATALRTAIAESAEFGEGTGMVWASAATQLVVPA